MNLDKGSVQNKQGFRIRVRAQNKQGFRIRVLYGIDNELG